MGSLRKTVASIKIKNYSSGSIDKLGVTYDGVGIQLFNLKNLGPKEIRKIEIPTEYFRNKTIIRMYTEDGHVYNIRENVSKYDNLSIEVTIKNVNKDGSLEFELN